MKQVSIQLLPVGQVGGVTAFLGAYRRQRARAPGAARGLATTAARVPHAARLSSHPLSRASLR